MTDNHSFVDDALTAGATFDWITPVASMVGNVASGREHYALHEDWFDSVRAAADELDINLYNEMVMPPGWYQFDCTPDECKSIGERLEMAQESKPNQQPAHKIGHYKSGNMFAVMAVTIGILFIFGFGFIAWPLVAMAIAFKGIEIAMGASMRRMGNNPNRPTGLGRAVPPMVATIAIVAVVLLAIVAMVGAA